MAQKTYLITDGQGNESKLKADRYEFDKSSGRHLFYRGSGENETLCGNLLNVSVAEQ